MVCHIINKVDYDVIDDLNDDLVDVHNSLVHATDTISSSKKSIWSLQVLPMV